APQSLHVGNLTVDLYLTYRCFSEQRRLGLVMCTRQVVVTVVVLFATFIATAQQKPTAPATAEQASTSSNSSGGSMGGSMDQIIDRAIDREHALIEMLKDRKPLIETYLQDLQVVPEIGPAPVDDHYFLGRMDLGDAL